MPSGIGAAAAGARPMAKKVVSPGLNPEASASWVTITVQVLVAVASAHKNPASSRAIAVITTLRLCLRASRRR